MAFGRKSILGTDYKQISSITEAQGTANNASLFNKIIWMIKNWCTTTFAAKSHTHSNIQPPSWPAYPKRVKLFDSGEYAQGQTRINAVANFSWTATSNCWIRIYGNGDSNDCAHMHEHQISLLVTSTYDDVTATKLTLFKVCFSKDFYRSDQCAMIPLRKGDVITLNHSVDRATTNLGIHVRIEMVYAADSAHV